MVGYWIRHRLPLSLNFSAIVAFIVVLLFVRPCITNLANDYNSESIYKNSDMDFIVPEPSFEQVNELPGTNGIEKVFPYFLTKTSIEANGKSRTTTVLLSDQTENLNITMYNDARLIKQSKTKVENPALVDWQFCKETSTDIGDSITLNLNGKNVEYEIYAIYETNTIYEGGAILVEISSDQKDAIIDSSKNNGYSGMYVKASDYSLCRDYLTNDYRPLGRLKDRDQFESEEQYQTHYDAITSSSYANEITDFRSQESSLEKEPGILLIWLDIALTAVLSIAFNVAMARRGCEKVYFAKQCIPKGQDVSQYYKLSFVIEIVVFVIVYITTLIWAINGSSVYIPSSALGIKLVYVPVSVLVAEIICLCLNLVIVRRAAKK